MDLRPSSRNPSGVAPARTGTLLTADGERISAAYDAPVSGSTALVFVVSHGFTGSWRRPDNRRIALALRAYGGVVSYDNRGHGASSGRTTLGDDEVLDLDAAVTWARWLGADDVVTVGFSMGGSVVLRQAALADLGSAQAPQAVVSVSAAGFWFYRGTPSMRLLHRAVETRGGRGLLKLGFGTRVTDRAWEEPFPLSPSEAAGLVPPLPLLVVHGDRDAYFPLEHARAIVGAAATGASERGVADRTEVWFEEGFGHAESATSLDIAVRIGVWATRAVFIEAGDRT